MLRQARYGRLNWSLLAQRVGFWAIGAGLLLFAVWPWMPGVGDRPARKLFFYGFSILADAMTEGIVPAFEQQWKARTGESLEVIASFAGSGTVTNQIVMGVPAQVAILSLELDALRLAEEGRVEAGAWRALPHGGVVNRTPFVILVRPGNPHRIRSFADLARPGVGVVHPDPLTSGGARWAILAEYGSTLRTSGDSSQALAALTGIWENVVAQGSSARAARAQFESGFGDALVTYEQEALADARAGDLDEEVVYPSRTVMSEHLVVVIEGNVDDEDRDLVHAFVEFLWSEHAQRIFVEHGFRSVRDELNTSNSGFAPIADPFTIADLGGWPEAEAGVIDALWRERVLPRLRR